MSGIKTLITLAGFGLLAGALLTAVSHYTQPHIETNRAKQRLSVFEQILPADLLATPQSEWHSCTPWDAGTVTSLGYAGEIELAFVWHNEQQSLRLRTVRHQETPGFGDFIAGSWLAEKDDWRAEQWAGVDNVSGATITFKALQKAAERLYVQQPVNCHAG